MPELLVEVGCEELPAAFVQRAYTDLLTNLGSLLETNGLMGEESGTAFGTPRRLIVSFPSIKARQEDSTKRQRGPAIKAAYDSEGNPTQALLGFCRGQGVQPADLVNDGTYVWASVHVPGRQARELLAELLPQAVRGLTFDKSMRWGASRMRFARPIRWLLAAFDGQVVPFEIEGVQASLTSRGHRFYQPEPFEATSLNDLLNGLRNRKVEADPEARRGRIVEEAQKVAQGIPELTEALVDENVFLTEWPTALQGAFKPEFMELPTPVLVTAMAKHERFFPVKDADGNLTNRFVSIRNSGVDGDVRKGNEWVLNARFNDAKFFYDEDRQHSLDHFLEKTSGIVFQEKLGNVRHRAERLSVLAARIAEFSGADRAEVEYARQAGLYAKADLSTGLVSELSSLQGVIGGEYARREGMADAVCWAIATHYDPSKNKHPDCAAARTAVRVTMADQLDKLAGYLGIGLVPSGSSDPFGLRRAVTILVEAAWGWPGQLPSMEEFINLALEGYASQGIQLNQNGIFPPLVELFAARYEALLPEVRYDVREAAVMRDRDFAALNPQAVRFRIRCMDLASENLGFVQMATRPLNILAAAKKKGLQVSSEDAGNGKLASEDAASLLHKLQEITKPVTEAREPERLVEALQQMTPDVNRFFDSTMVMSDDAGERAARLGLLQMASELLLFAGDFSTLVQER